MIKFVQNFASLIGIHLDKLLEHLQTFKLCSFRSVERDCKVHDFSSCKDERRSHICKTVSPQLNKLSSNSSHKNRMARK
ncbi:hypothetical protein PMI35_03964 [Pseudomonas sp. GM78]|nr:hypothetical protein PMI35_03964 [Pseudomonas sp. GM78]